MKITLQVEKEFEIKTMLVKAGARYWEDSEINGIPDENGDLIPCRDGDYWCPNIDIETGKILNWEQGKSANIHYKVCDDGEYTIIDEQGYIIKSSGHGAYVPDMLCPKERGYGDYIIMDIDENGMISNWKFDKSFFEN